MSEDEQSNVIAFGKVLGKRLPDSQLTRIGSANITPSTEEWKALCFEILKEIAEQERQRLGFKQFGMSLLRDLVMQDFDRKSGVKLAGRERAFSHKDLDYWENTGRISDAKFVYVDHFIRKISFDGEWSDILDEIKDVSDRTLAQSFGTIYGRRNLRQDQTDKLNSAASTYLMSDVVQNSHYQYIAIKPEFIEVGILKLTCAYCPFNLLQPDYSRIHEAVFYEGFLIPSAWYADLDTEQAAIGDGKAPRVETWHATLKLFRPQMRGSAFSGQADANMTLTFSREFPDKLAPGIYAEPPRDILSPHWEIKCEDQRYAPGPASKRQEFRFRKFMYDHEFIAKIFEDGYKGYLF